MNAPLQARGRTSHTCWERIRPRGCTVISSVMCGWALAVAMLAAAGQEDGGPYPRLPGEETVPPDLAARHAPFDIKAFFRAPPRASNGAYPYLDALFEFGPEVADCFEPGPRRDRRKAEAEGRVKRFMDVWSAFADEKPVAPAAMDAAVKDFDAGYRKLAQAQRMPKCVFLSGTGADALIPHAQVMRTVARASQVRARRMLDRGEIDAAIDELSLVLRMTRDLRPRGSLICQLVGDVVELSVFDQIAQPILAHPKLTAAQCDRFIRMLYDHERAVPDGWSEGLKAEYVMNVRIITEGMPEEPVIAKALKASPPSAAEVEAASKQVAAAYAIVLKAVGSGYRQQSAAIKEAEEQFTRETLADKIALMGFPAVDQFISGEMRCRANGRAILALAAVKQWQLAHSGQAPPSLTEACQAAKVILPLDPYDGDRLRYVVREGVPIVYAIGKDLRDDGGAIDSKKETEPGDIVLQLPLKK